MNWKQFYEELGGKELKSVYLFTGEEAFIRRAALEKLRQKLLPPGLEAMNETLLEETSAQAIIEACETLPFMAEKRLVVVRDYAPLMSGASKDEENQVKRLSQWLPGIPDSCCLVFSPGSRFDGRKKLSSQLVKMGAQVEFAPLDDADLGKWIRGQAKDRGCSIAPAAAHRLVFLAGRDLTRLSGELDKLSAYGGKGSVLEEEMVNKLVSPSLEAGIFQMIDNLMEGRSAAAFSLLKEMLQSGESRMGILFMLTRQFRLLSHCRLLTSQGIPRQEAARQLSLSPYVAERLARQAARFSPQTLTAMYEDCVQAEYRIKSGRAREEAALDELILKVGLISKG